MAKGIEDMGKHDAFEALKRRAIEENERTYGREAREAHRRLAQMYLADDRFRAYYDTAAGEGATEFLAAALESCLA